MLQRAADNAYSWWWASNIRSKQSKWLDNNLQEMEERVKSMVKLIEVDADSFAKKAELYFQRRPELINFVEETYKAYRALADRYDRISGDLHKANHTIASAFPDQFQLAMQDEEEDGSPKAITAFDTSKLLKAQPLINLRNKGRDACSALKKQHKKASSHLTKESAQNEIDSLQKEFIVLQTEKEFVKSSYERSLTRFWEIESQISDLQDEICTLQDEYSVNSIIENNEARALMAVTAFKSCEENLVSLQQQHKKSGEEADLESKRIREIKGRLKSLKGENCSQEVEKIIDEEEHFHFKNDEVDLYSVCAQVKQHFQLNSDTSIVKLAEKIDGLVEKFINLEVKVSSQTAQIQTLRHETDVLHKFLRGLEEDKSSSMIDSNNLNERLMLAEDEFHGVEDLGKNISHEKGIFQTHFLEVCNSINDISEKLHSPRHKEKDDSAPLNQQIDGDLAEKNVDLDRQKMLQCKYALNLRNCKDTKKRLTEMEMTYQEYHFEMIAQIQELKSANAVKDQEIRSLRRKLFSHSSSKSDFPIEILETEREIHLCQLDQLHFSSPIEERFRAELDTLLDENLNFWLRFSTSYHHIQKFEASFKELQAPKNSSKEETVPLEKRLRELHTELQVWLEQNGLLKEELQCRFTALSNIQEEITKASSDAVDEDSKFRPFEAAKFQGELLNMQQENNKVAMELQTGLDHVKGLQTEVSQALSKLRESFDLTVSNEYQQYQNFRHSSTRSKVPLRTFLFGEKRKKPSIFSCMSPALLRHHHSQMKYGFPP